MMKSEYDLAWYQSLACRFYPDNFPKVGTALLGRRFKMLEQLGNVWVPYNPGPKPKLIAEAVLSDHVSDHVFVAQTHVYDVDRHEFEETRNTTRAIIQRALDRITALEEKQEKMQARINWMDTSLSTHLHNYFSPEED